MKFIKTLAASVLAASATLLLTAAPAQAQATRTWVSGVGDDVNPCSRTAPCKTFAGAISKTAAGGEINCLDPGGFGAVTITKSMTIDCHYTEGGALAGGNGIVVNDSASATPGQAVVFLRGLDIFGVNPPTHGVRILSGSAVHIQDTVIRRFNSAGSFGVSFQPSVAMELYIDNSIIAENGNGATGGGILIQPTGAGGSGKVLISNVQARNNSNDALRVDLAGNTSATATQVSVNGGTFSGSSNGIVVSTAVGTSTARLMLVDSTLAHNSNAGMIVTGNNSSARVGNTTITFNGTGVAIGAPAVVQTYGTNRLNGNNVDGTFSGAPIPQQ